MSAPIVTRDGKTDRLSRVVVDEGTAYLSGLTADDKSQNTVGQTSRLWKRPTPS